MQVGGKSKVWLVFHLINLVGPTALYIVANAFSSVPVWPFLPLFFKLQGAELSHARTVFHSYCPLQSLLWPAFPLPFDTAVMQSEGYVDLYASRTVTLMLITKTDVHPRPEMSVFCLIISHGRTNITQQLIFRCTFSANWLRHYISKLFSYPSVEAMQRKAACLISQWTY